MSVLDQIFETKRQEVQAAKAVVPLVEMRAIASDQPPPRGFLKALERAEGTALIAEIKRSSPSQGPIRPDLVPAELARIYEESGASALSVLTDQAYFGGSSEDLVHARAATHLPVLRKDFVCDPYQVFEARALGADAVLLIVAGLSFSQVVDLQALSFEMGMDALVEVHSEAEAQTALKAECPLVGVNNRDLSTFETNLDISDRLILLFEGKSFVVGESALQTKEDVLRIARAGARGVLIGTAFCSAPDIGAKVLEVMGQ
jgi:indole-3-glycerol phosphate synthase